ncbi:MAG: hypothetical protein JW959_08370 [Pirellulales bacterium]|nr:hypothetical protein [Pirellulales bacterium]
MPIHLRCPLIVVSLFLIGILSLQTVGSEDTQADDHPLVGKTVIVHLRSGKTLKGVIVEKVVPGKIPATVSRLQVRDPATGSRPVLGAAGINRITSVDGQELLVFEEKSRCLAPPDEETLAKIRQAAEAKKVPRKSYSPRKKTPKENAGAQPSDDEQSRRNRNEEKRKAFFDKTGVWLYPELTEEQQAEAYKETKEFVGKVSEKFASLNMRLYETKYYLFLSDLPPQIAAIYTSCLDNMHKQLCQAFDVKNPNAVWLGGKMPVFAFVHGEHFVEFEREFFKHNVPQMAQGLCHSAPNGFVVVSCRCGTDPKYFAGVIVHESTHGFVHRYMSPEIIPNWINEGIAEWVNMTVVKTNHGVQKKIKASIAEMQKTGTLGPNFFTADNIAANQYGTATAMVEFMLRADPKAFRKMIDDIKSGVKWQDALKKNFKVTPEQLTQKFGMAVVGIPMLRP